ncbi:MAG TPA: hypothetical protein DCM28_08315 [Phycisphaerales bacterium]|nr:hypothetical protein [Phycisphaerales bacterium]HCD31650.1 hypothetical protein [Phycisphaerales bacterium]|tara:strand:- start:408 stop:1109 length:702 start_codon:yes stop_codon:yes gene_type:complete
MPCYIFSYFPYRFNELPARSHRQRVNQELRRKHRMAHDLVDQIHLFPHLQNRLIDMTVQWAPTRNLRLHYVHTTDQYIQIVVSWRFYAPIHDVQLWFLQDISYQLNKDRYFPQQWFSRHYNRKQIADRVTYDYLVGEYMPTQAQFKWVDPKPLPPTDEVHPRNVRCFDQLLKKQVLDQAGLITAHGKLKNRIDSPYKTLNQAYKAMDEGWLPLAPAPGPRPPGVIAMQQRELR